VRWRGVFAGPFKACSNCLFQRIAPAARAHVSGRASFMDPKAAIANYLLFVGMARRVFGVTDEAD
jgi:hypothetical protein